MTESGHPRYDGLAGLRRANPVELAAEVFIRLFAGTSLAKPFVPGVKAERVLVELSGVRAGGGLTGAAGWLGLTVARTPALQPYVVETVALWQQTRVAGSRSAGGQGATVLVLMRRGEDLLRSPHPAGHLRDLLLNAPSEY